MKREITVCRLRRFWSFTKIPGTFFPLAALLPMVLLAVAGCTREEAIHQPKVEVPAGPDQVFVNTRFVVTENGATDAIIRADSVKVYQDANISMANGNLKVDFFDRQGVQISTLTAEKGIVYGMAESIDSLRADGNVVVFWNRRNAKMETPFIRWISVTRMVYADSIVALSVDNAEEHGVGFTAPDDLSSYTMGRVTGIIENQKIDIPGR